MCYATPLMCPWLPSRSASAMCQPADYGRSFGVRSQLFSAVYPLQQRNVSVLPDSCLCANALERRSLLRYEAKVVAFELVWLCEVSSWCDDLVYVLAIVDTGAALTNYGMAAHGLTAPLLELSGSRLATGWPSNLNLNARINLQLSNIHQVIYIQTTRAQRFISLSSADFWRTSRHRLPFPGKMSLGVSLV